MKRTLRILFFVFLFFEISGFSFVGGVKRLFRGEPTPQEKLGEFSYSYFVSKKVLPEGAKLYVLFHPAGSSGEEFIERWIPLTKKDNVVLLAPTASANARYGSKEFEEKLEAVVADFENRYHIASGSRFLIAESNGAIYGYLFLVKKPDFFRAAVFISGVVDERFVNQVKEAAQPIKSSILMVHGTEDKTFNIGIARKQKEYLKSIGLSVELREMKRMGHGADPFAEEEIIKWLRGFNQK